MNGYNVYNKETGGYICHIRAKNFAAAEQELIARGLKDLKQYDIRMVM